MKEKKYIMKKVSKFKVVIIISFVLLLIMATKLYNYEKTGAYKAEFMCREIGHNFAKSEKGSDKEFCEVCGVQKVMRMKPYCKNCSKYNEVGADVCSKCGVKLETSKSYTLEDIGITYLEYKVSKWYPYICAWLAAMIIGEELLLFKKGCVLKKKSFF